MLGPECAIIMPTKHGARQIYLNQIQNFTSLNLKPHLSRLSAHIRLCIIYNRFRVMSEPTHQLQKHIITVYNANGYRMCRLCKDTHSHKVLCLNRVDVLVSMNLTSWFQFTNRIQTSNTNNTDFIFTRAAPKPLYRVSNPWGWEERGLSLIHISEPTRPP